MFEMFQPMRHQLPGRKQGTSYGFRGGQNLLAQALTRLLGGKDWDESGQAYAVHVEDLCVGHLGLEPGRGGWVIPVLEELPSTIIAYALNSNEYYERHCEYYQESGMLAPSSSSHEAVFPLNEGGQHHDGVSSPSSAPPTPSPYPGKDGTQRAQDEGSPPLLFTREELEKQLLSQHKTHIKVISASTCKARFLMVVRL